MHKQNENLNKEKNNHPQTANKPESLELKNTMMGQKN